MSTPQRNRPSREVTAESLYMRRREWLKDAALMVATAGGLGGSLLGLIGGGGRTRAGHAPAIAPRALAIAEHPAPRGHLVDATTALADITTYNNFYEFGLGKSDPSQASDLLRTRPWTIMIDGEVARRRTLDIDQLLAWFPLEERIYRMRCVEAWSMVIPWDGFPLADLIRKLEPTSRAKYVAFTTLLDAEQMPEASASAIDFPYVEGLRIDEAMHPLTLLAVGLYGKTLPNQNGAPLRLVVPWKYGFKGIKSIVRISFTEAQPVTTWSRAAPGQYGFYANVNPLVDHPRWSQASERRIGELERRPTLPFNGYGDEVASLYAGLDLRRNI